jgi:uncharacterized protein YdiU (UPF0061 family)
VAELIGLDPGQQHRKDFVEVLTEPGLWQQTDPLAMCYSGHQFGQYVPRLGDGRALLLGQVRSSSKQLWDIQLKGSGLTLYSRQGDGKAVLRSTIREYLASAAMHGLGIPTTYALALIGSDEPVYRETIETGAMLVRIATSHIRFGTFEYYFYNNRYDDLRQLADYVIENYFPELQGHDSPSLALLSSAVQSTAELIAHWQSVGFCHGVMNSDNMSIHGLTIDYGPYGFLDKYESAHICNHSDHGGRYAFNRQPGIGLFNLSCLAQAMLPLFDDDPDQAVEKATVALKEYQGLFDQAYLRRKRLKLGLASPDPGDGALYDDLLDVMEAGELDFTRTFRMLSESENEEEISACLEPIREAENDTGPQWLRKYYARLEKEVASQETRSAAMKLANPKFILRNYMAENAIRQARDNGDCSELDRLICLLKSPYDEQPQYESYASEPPEWATGIAVSCSS